MEIRVATRSDIPQIVDLVNVAFRLAEGFFVEGDRTNPAQIEAMFQTGTFLLADVSGELAACVYLELRGERAYFGLLSVDRTISGKAWGVHWSTKSNDAPKKPGAESWTFLL